MRPLASLLAVFSAFTLTAAGTLAAPPNAASFTRILPIADNAFAGSSINVTANTRSSLFTHSTSQFAAFYDAEGYLVLAKRALGADTWQTQRTAHRANTADAHNSVSLAIDGAGFLHVAWDHHNSALRYARSTAPLSLELAAPSSMTGERESRVTYPQFHLTAAGDLFFLYRDGGSGNGSLVLNRYDTAAQKWSTVQPNLIDGEGRRSPYWDLHLDRRGTLHLAWIWRDSPDVATNHDLAYARSTDGGTTWTKSDGSALKLPITASTAEYAQQIPTGRNLMNPPVVDTDKNGRPFLCSYWSPRADAAPQFHIVHHDGSAWRLISGPKRSQSFTLAGVGTKRPPISRAAFLVDTTWDRLALHLIYRDDALGGRAILATHSGHAVGGDWTLRELTTASLGAWEPTIDPVLWRRFPQAHLLVQSVVQKDGDDREAGKTDAAAISSLIWAPVTDRMRASSDRAASTETPPIAAASEAPIDPSSVLPLAQRVIDWQWAHLPAAEKHHPRNWVIAPFYLGVLAVDRVSPDHRNRERMLEHAENALTWQPHKRIYHADDHCVIQAYLELYQHYREPRMLEPSKQRFDQILAHPSHALFDWGTPHSDDHWSWCDALFMAPVAWLQLWKETGDNRYLEFMNSNWKLTTDRLFLPNVGFYLRDESYLDLREANGKTIHWSRGNGWVFAGLARVLDLFPKDHPDYPRYVELYQTMARAVLATQQPDGLWRVGLLDPDTHTVRESSGSSFYTFGLAWGINRGFLERATAEPAVRRGWHALVSCVTPEGRLEHVQPIGHAPEGFDPHHTDVFAVGAFLLAASEVSQLK